MLIAALTGNFGMGKSYVLSLFRELGAATVESDRIVGMLLREEEVIAKVVALLGDDVKTADGRLDKKAIAYKVFHDSLLRQRLEALIHPLVFEKVDRFIGGIKKKDTLVIIEVPLLFEGNYQSGYEKVITVFTPDETALKRLEGAGVPQNDAKARLESQLPISEKKARSDYVIDNSGSKEDTRRQVEEVYRSLCEEIRKRKG
jgi:dephospho-CoA kinase